MRLSGRLVKFDFLNPPPLQLDEPEQLICLRLNHYSRVIGQLRERDIFVAEDTLHLSSTIRTCPTTVIVEHTIDQGLFLRSRWDLNSSLRIMWQPLRPFRR